MDIEENLILQLKIIVNFKFIISNNFKNKITYKVSNKKVYIQYFKDKITIFSIYNNLLIYIKRDYSKSLKSNQNSQLTKSPKASSAKQTKSS